jgi:hypothetical protein
MQFYHDANRAEAGLELERGRGGGRLQSAPVSERRREFGKLG